MVIVHEPIPTDTSSSNDGTLSGQTSSSDPFNTSIDSSDKPCAVAQVITGNGNDSVDDDTDDDTTEDDDDDEQSDKQYAITQTTKRYNEPLPSDASSHMSKRPPKRNKVHEKTGTIRNERAVSKHDGDTGSSSSGLRPIAPTIDSNVHGNGRQFSEQSTNDLNGIIATLKQQLKRETEETIASNKSEVIAQATRLVETVKSEEAWTAQQHAIQVEASANAEF